MSFMMSQYESVNTALSTSGYLFNGDGGPTS